MMAIRLMTRKMSAGRTALEYVGYQEKKSNASRVCSDHPDYRTARISWMTTEIDNKTMALV